MGVTSKTRHSRGPRAALGRCSSIVDASLECRLSMAFDAALTALGSVAHLALLPKRQGVESSRTTAWGWPSQSMSIEEFPCLSKRS